MSVQSKWIYSENPILKIRLEFQNMKLNYLNLGIYRICSRFIMQCQMVRGMSVSFEFKQKSKVFKTFPSQQVHFFRSHLININGKEREERIDASQDKDICLLNVEVRETCFD